jgi:hypothetical protein
MLLRQLNQQGGEQAHFFDKDSEELYFGDAT